MGKKNKDKGRLTRTQGGDSQPNRSGEQRGPSPDTYRPPMAPSLAGKSDYVKIFAAAALLVGGVWSYWPTVAGLVGKWNSQPDYSHGYFVIPLALYFLWARRDRFPGAADGIAWAGMILMAASIAMRMFSARYYMMAIDGWSIMLWVGGMVWLLWGRKVFWWSLPSIAFLWFMIPLPYRVERWLSLPLQRVATKLSCWTLQLLGQPALGQGNTIHLGEHQLEVEQACSGLRIFVGIVALAFAYIIITRRPWWEKALLLVSVIPIALVANATRIVGMGLLYQLVSSEAGQHFSHDISGLVMIPFAAGLFALVLWYLGHLVQEVEQVDVKATIRRQRV
jgi:exosortase